MAIMLNFLGQISSVNHQSLLNFTNSKLWQIRQVLTKNCIPCT